MPPRRRHPTSPPAANPLDDENLIAEFLLRLPPRPSSLPRAAAVCKTWRRVVIDPHFLRRFRAHHRGKAPLLGFFDAKGVFFPTLEAPDRVPASRLSVSWNVVACRDGLVLCSQGLQLQVLDPMTGQRSAIVTREDKLPKPLNVDLVVDSTAGERLCFRLFAISTDADERELSLSVYLSDSGAWVHSVETLVTRSAFIWSPGTLVGNAFYWTDDIGRILRYDLETQTIAIIEVPWNDGQEQIHVCGAASTRILSKEGCFVTQTIPYKGKFNFRIWVNETVPSSAGKWMMRKTVLLDTLLLPLELKSEPTELYVVGFDKENKLIFLWIPIGIFMINLESVKFTKVSKRISFRGIHPYSSFVTAG